MQINLTQNWRTPDRARGERLWTPGHYRVPDDMPENIAASAIKAGAAEEIKPAIAAESGAAARRLPFAVGARDALLQRISPRWNSATCIVAATGPSLTPEVAEACRGHRVVAIKDAARLLMPWADVLYCCDAWWWEHWGGCPEFQGERWSVHEDRVTPKRDVAAKFGINLVQGRHADTFSTDPGVLHYGSNSGFQAINLAILLGATRILLVGFNMQGGHFFGGHPSFRAKADHRRFIHAFETAAKHLPRGVKIINCTPGSALTCFPTANLTEALNA